MNLFKSTKAITYISSRGDKVYPIIMDIKTGIVEGDAVFTTGDIDTAYLYATILEEQSDYNILGSTVICNIQRPDGTTMKVQGDVLGNNLIEFPLGQSGVSQEGIYNFDIAVVFSEKKMVTSPTAQYSVTQSIEVIGEIEEDDRFPILESLISGINVINEEELVRISNEEDRQSKEEAREQAESVRVRNEETRLANNEAIRNEEAVRVVSENERKNAESLRVQEENKRKQQENTRITQENTRVSQETARVNAENTRKNQEATRQANEATRVSQETNRSQAESTRNSNETVRQNQENTRKNQEQARVTAEGNRVTSENVRVSAEQARVLKEQERQAIEVERQNSESTREQQEATRVSQENTRKQADILRQQEHESRQQFLNGFEGKLNTVVDDVATIKDDVVSVREANKRQDIFLQGLYNENLDGRVTVKEEGSVISLTNSDDGLVDIVGLEGNTMVNYVQDGAKELVLNGEIEAQGTNVTVTDCVDNGLVDVVCEGNTLVNILEKIEPKDISKSVNTGFIKLIKNVIPNKTHTLIFEVSDLNLDSQEYVEMLVRGNLKTIGFGATTLDNKIRVNKNGIYYTEWTELNEVESVLIGLASNNKQEPSLTISNIMVVEGSVNDVSYFEGMKSVAECEDGKLEIVSSNKNLFDGQLELGSLTSNGTPTNDTRCVRTVDYIKIKPSTPYIISNDKSYTQNIYFYDINYSPIETINTKNSFITPSNCMYIKFRSNIAGEQNDLSVKFQLEEGNVATSYVPHSLNKKEITLSEPLRALPNGVCDKVVKIGGKWYVERNCGQIVLDGSEDWKDYSTYTNDIITTKATRKPSDCKSKSKIVCRDFYTKDPNGIDECIAIGLNNLELSIKTSKLSSQNKTDLKKWLSANPTIVVYELETPTYEELSIDPTINTYNDITHISNNSTIPCNMKIQNTGYNAIIKPSTQYTVAFDTDKSGTVGINLGGSKVTTTNNVATVTTPSTLVDDSLRLTGKGIKANNIRLLEGDKTNWIPSYFEGMKSCFEDKLQDDGTYKMEILSEGENKLNGYNFARSIFNSVKNSVLDTENKTIKYNAGDVTGIVFKPIKFKEKTVYTFIFKGYNDNENLQSINLQIIYTDGSNSLIPNFISGVTTLTSSKGKTVSHIIGNWSTFATTLYYDECGIFEGVNVPFEPYKYHNKIQFSSIEPLRGVGDVKDRFVFKEDGKLMIERNCGEIVLNGSEGDKTIMAGGRWYKSGATGMTSVFVLYDTPKKIGYNTSICERFTNTYNSSPFTSGEIKSFTYTDHPTLTTMYFNYGDNPNVTVKEFCEWLSKNPTTVVYQLAEPTYEEVPYELQKIILEGYINGTLFLDTNIPPTVEVSYTANIPVVSELNKNSNEIVVTQEDLSVTQVAVDFLLMSNLGEEMLSSFNINTRGRNSMGAYFANRITKGALKYEDVISKYPQYKEEIDSILESK